jgi:hypothetical protein
MGGSYGIATAAGGSNEGSTSSSSTATETATAAANEATPTARQPWGGRRSDETALTGDALAKVSAAAQARVSGGTIVRVETDADGHAAYEAHMTDADGERVTVYVDEDFNVVSVESR